MDIYNAIDNNMFIILYLNQLKPTSHERTSGMNVRARKKSEAENLAILEEARQKMGQVVNITDMNYCESVGRKIVAVEGRTIIVVQTHGYPHQEEIPVEEIRNFGGSAW